MRPASAPVHAAPRELDARLVLLVLLAGAGGLVSLADDAAPTGLSGVDGFWRFLAGAVVVACAGFAHPVAWVLSSVLAAASSSQVLLILVGLLTLAVAAAATRFAPNRPDAGGLVGLGVVFVIFRLPHDQFLGVSTVAAIVIALPIVLVGWYYGPYTLSRGLSVAASFALASAVAAGVVLVVTAIQVRSDMNDATDTVDRALDRFRSGDEESARALLDDALERMADAQEALARPWVRPTRWVPVVSQHVRTMEGVADQAVLAGTAATDVLDALDRDALTIEGGRVQLDAISSMQPSIRRLADTSASAQDELRALHSPWLVAPVSNALDDAVHELDEVVESAGRAAAAAELSPAILGQDGPRNHLVLFVTPAELRGSVGLVGNWAHVIADAGALQLASVGRAEDLSVELAEVGATLSGPPSFLDRYGTNLVATNYHDVTLSPDFPDVALVAAELFEAARGVPIDGVMLVDPHAMEGILQITGPQNVLGRVIDSSNVRDFMLLQQYDEFSTEDGRVAFLSQLLTQTFTDLLTVDFPDPWDLDEVFADPVAADRLMVAAVRPDEQALLDDLGIGGAFDPGPGDMVAVVTQNAGQNKIDTFLERRVVHAVELDPLSGRLAATVTIDLTNAVPDGDFPDAVIGNNDQGFPFGTNVTELTVYTPHTLTGATVDGEEAGFGAFEEFGVRGYSRTIEIPRGERASITLELEGTWDTSKAYELRLLGQALVLPDQIEVRVRAPGHLVNGAQGEWTAARLTSEDVDFRVELVSAG